MSSANNFGLYINSLWRNQYNRSQYGCIDKR